MKTLLTGAVLAAAMLAWAPSSGAATTDAKTTYKAAMDGATAEYKAARSQCKTLTGNANDVCIAEAKAAEKRAKAEAKAKYMNTPEAQSAARMVIAQADYDVAKAKCGAKMGEERKACIKEAKAARAKAAAEARPVPKVS